MRPIYKKGSIVIIPVENGYRVQVRGSVEQQEDDMDREFVFEDEEKMTAWIREREFARWKKERQSWLDQSRDQAKQEERQP